MAYSPVIDGRPEPGEVVWAWVPFENNPTGGKDRPVLVLSVQGSRMTALAMTTRDEDRDQRKERRYGRLWMDVGSGGWDPKGRESAVRLDQVLRLSVYDVRRHGTALDPDVFAEVLAAVRPYL